MIKTVLKKGLQWLTKIGLMYFAGKMAAASSKTEKCDNCGKSFFDDYIYRFTETKHEKYGIPATRLCADCANVKERPEGVQ